MTALGAARVQAAERARGGRALRALYRLALLAVVGGAALQLAAWVPGAARRSQKRTAARWAGGYTLRIARKTMLIGALPRVIFATERPEGRLTVLSGTFSGPDTVSLAQFDLSGRLIGKLAGTDIPTGLSRVEGFRVDHLGDTWVSTLYPPELARFSQGSLISAVLLKAIRITYGLALDETRGRVFVAGCSPRSKPPGGCLLIHQFTFPGLQYVRSFLPTAPEVLQKRQFSVQTVPIEVGPRGNVWAIDSPAWTLYSIDPSSGRVSSHPIQSRVMPRAGAFDAMGGAEYVRTYMQNAAVPVSIVISGRTVIVCVRRSGHFWLELFNLSGAQIGTDVPAPGRLVGTGRGDALLFGASSKGGAQLIRAELRDLR